jgi:hypothetical protein
VQEARRKIKQGPQFELQISAGSEAFDGVAARREAQLPAIETSHENAAPPAHAMNRRMSIKAA